MDEVLKEGRYARLISRDGWEFVQRTNATGIVVIVAATPEDRVILVEQYRPPVRARVIEMPAGLAGDIDAEEALATAAQRELEEETGWRAASMTWLCEGPVSAGLSDEVITVFKAEGLVRVGPGGGDASEDIVVHEIPRDEVRDWLHERNRAGVLVDPKVYAALVFL